jgi:hypothetical protein
LFKCAEGPKEHISNLKLCQHGHKHIFSVFSCRLLRWLTLNGVFLKPKKAMIDVPANLTVARDKKQNDLAD